MTLDRRRKPAVFLLFEMFRNQLILFGVVKKHGMAFRNYKAFMMHVLDEFTLDEIVDRIWGRGVSAAKRAQYKGDLYVIKSRMLVWLRKDVDYFEAV